MLDSISSGFQTVVETVTKALDVGDRGQDATYRSPLEIYAFLLQWFCAAAERHASKGGADISIAAPTKAKVRYVVTCLLCGHIKSIAGQERRQKWQAQE